MSANQKFANEVSKSLAEFDASDHESTINATMRYIEASFLKLDEAAKTVGVSTATFGKFFPDENGQSESPSPELTALAKASAFYSPLWTGRRYLKSAIDALAAKYKELLAGKERIRTTNTPPAGLLREYAAAKGIARNEGESTGDFVQRLSELANINPVEFVAKLNAAQLEIDRMREQQKNSVFAAMEVTAKSE